MKSFRICALAFLLLLMLAILVACELGGKNGTEDASVTSESAQTTEFSETTESVTETEEITTEVIETEEVTEEITSVEEKTEVEETEPEPQPEPEPEPVWTPTPEPQPEPEPVWTPTPEPEPVWTPAPEPQPEPEPIDMTVPAWGSRPYEFEGIGFKDNTFAYPGLIAHWDRYGNMWFDFDNFNNTAHGKYVYSNKCGIFFMFYPRIRYFGNNRWGGYYGCWDSTGEWGVDGSEFDYWGYSTRKRSWGENCIEVSSEAPDYALLWVHIQNIFTNNIFLTNEERIAEEEKNNDLPAGIIKNCQEKGINGFFEMFPHYGWYVE